MSSGIDREDGEQDVGVHQEHSLVSTRELQDIIGAEFAVGGALRLTETFLDMRRFAQHRPDHHATVTLVEGDLRVGKQPELQSERLRDGHLSF